MNPVSGRGVVIEPGSIHPAPRATSASSTVTRIANANPWASRRRPPSVSRRWLSTTPVATAATAPNSGPTTIAPTTRIEESRTTATPAISVASVRNA